MAISPIGTLISGLLAELLGIRNLYLYCAIIGGIIPIVMWRLTNIKSIEYDGQIVYKFSMKKLGEITFIAFIIRRSRFI